MKLLLYLLSVLPLFALAQNNTIITGNGSSGSGSTIIPECGESDTANFLVGYLSQADCADYISYASGTYTPTITNRFGLTSTTSGTFTYLRIDNIVTINGSIQFVDSSSSTVVWVMKLSLPISSDFTMLDDAVGTASIALSSSPYVTPINPAILFAQPSTDLIYCTGSTNNNSTNYVNVTCTYKIK